MKRGNFKKQKQKCYEKRKKHCLGWEKQEGKMNIKTGKIEIQISLKFYDDCLFPGIILFKQWLLWLFQMPQLATLRISTHQQSTLWMKLRICCVPGRRVKHPTQKRKVLGMTLNCIWFCSSISGLANLVRVIWRIPFQ